MALCRRLLEPKERGIENNLSHCNSEHHRALIIVFCPKGAPVSMRHLSCFSPYPLLRENIYIKNQAWEKDGSPKNLQQGSMEKYYFACQQLFGLTEHVISTVKRSVCTELCELILVSVPVPTSSNSELSLLLKMNSLHLSGTCQFKPW